LSTPMTAVRLPKRIVPPGYRKTVMK